MLQVVDLALPDHHDDPRWQAYQALHRRWNHEMIDGPGWNVSPEAALDLARRSADEERITRILGYVDDEAVGLATIRVNTRDEPDAGNVIVYVVPERRSAGIGRRLAESLGEAVDAQGLVRLSTWIETPPPSGPILVPTTGIGAVPGDHPGVRMALSYGFTLEQVERVSRYDFAAPLIDPHEAVAEASARAGDDYEVITWTGAASEEMLADLAVLKQRMTTDPPSGGLAVVEAVWDADRAREMDRRWLPTKHMWRAAVRHRPSGAFVALSELMRDRVNPDAFVEQWDTIVLPEHRGHRLGMLVKAANLIQVREAAPDAEAILTWNAEENRYMLDVNEALGFRPYLVEGAFQRLLTGLSRG